LCYGAAGTIFESRAGITHLNVSNLNYVVHDNSLNASTPWPVNSVPTDLDWLHVSRGGVVEAPDAWRYDEASLLALSGSDLEDPETWRGGLDGTDDYALGVARTSTGHSVQAGRVWLYGASDKIIGRDFEIVTGGMTSFGRIDAVEHVRITDDSPIGGFASDVEQREHQARLFDAVPQCYATADESIDQQHWRLSNWTVRTIGSAIHEYVPTTQFGLSRDYPEHDLKLALMDDDVRTGFITINDAEIEFDFGTPVTLTGFFITPLRYNNWIRVWATVLNQAPVMVSNTTDDDLQSLKFSSIFMMNPSQFDASRQQQYYVQLGQAVTARYWRFGAPSTYIGLSGVKFFCGRQAHVMEDTSYFGCSGSLCRAAIDLKSSHSYASLRGSVDASTIDVVAQEIVVTDKMSAD